MEGSDDVLSSRLQKYLQDGETSTDKQERILKTAIEVFSEKGYAASTTSEIAQRAGVAEGTIFHHYKTKKDLLLSIVSPTWRPIAMKGQDEDTQLWALECQGFRAELG